MNKGKNDKASNPGTEEEVQAEAERAYLEDDSQKPDIPQDLQERFNKISSIYDDYARAAKLEEKDIEELRKELEDYYGTAMASGMPMAVIDLSHVSEMSDEEIEEEARKLHLD